MIVTRSMAAALCLAASFLPAQADAAVLLDFATDTSSFAWYGNYENCNPCGASYTLGYSFTVDGSVAVDGLGVYDAGSDGLTMAHDVGLWNAQTGTLLAQTRVGNDATATEASSSGQGRYMFETIAELMLGAGSYVVAAFYQPGSRDHVAWDVEGITSSMPGVAYSGLAYSRSTSLVRPTLTSFEDDRYFGPAVRAVGITPVPLPGAAALMLSALGALVLARRRTGGRATA